MKVALVGVVTAALSAPAVLAQETPAQLVTVVHVHSRATSGSLSLTRLAAMADAAGVDALVMTENLGYQFRYAPSWLRPFVQPTVAGPTLERYGIDRYLAELEQARTTTPRVTLVAGVEVPPYYYWTGSLLRGDLTLHDMQRNVLVLPPADDPEAATRLLYGLPAVGNSNLRRLAGGSLALIVPGLLLMGSAYGLYRRTGRSAWRRVLWPALALAGAALLIVNYPYTVAPLQPYGADAGPTAVQRLFDHVRESGGLAFWSMPEAVDYRSHRIGPVTARLSTDPYPAALILTHGYTGFGGVYADTVAAWEPDGVWDEALRAYQSGERMTPPWLLGESAYHWPDHAGKQLDDVLTVVQTDGRGAADVLDALAAGAMYAVRREPGSADLRLGELALLADGGRAGAPPAVARLGETLPLPAAGPASFDIVVRIEDLAAPGTAVVVEVVRNGALLRRFETVTPVHERWRETLDAGERAAYYRIVAYAGRPAYLVSNPVFARRGADAAHGSPPPGR